MVHIQVAQPLFFVFFPFYRSLCCSIFPFCRIFAAGIFWGPRRNRRLRWGERRQSCALCRSATSDSAICRTRGFLFQQFSACEVPDRACSMGCTAAFPANVGVLCSGFPTPSVPCDRPAVRAVSCAGDFHEPVPSNPPQSYNKKKAPTTCGRLLALCGTKVPRKSLFWH